MELKRLLRLILGFLVCGLITIFVLIKTNFIHFPKDHAPQIKEPISSIAVSIKGYKVYNLDDLPFRFILANINLVNNKPIEFELSRFMTNEQVRLDKVDDFKTEITSKGYDLSKQNVTNILNSNENSINATILIPIKSNHINELTLNIAGVQPSQLTFDLNRYGGSSLDLGKEISLIETKPNQSESKKPIEGNKGGQNQTISNSLTVSAASEIDPKLISYVDQKGQSHAVRFKKGARAFLVNVSADYENEILISAARMNFEGSQELVFALGSSYQIENDSFNVLMRPMTQDTGYLLFIIDSTSNDPINQPYKIEMRVNNQSRWLEVLIK